MCSKGVLKQPLSNGFGPLLFVGDMMEWNGNPESHPIQLMVHEEFEEWMKPMGPTWMPNEVSKRLGSVGYFTPIYPIYKQL